MKAEAEVATGRATREMNTAAINKLFDAQRVLLGHGAFSPREWPTFRTNRGALEEIARRAEISSGAPYLYGATEAYNTPYSELTQGGQRLFRSQLEAASRIAAEEKMTDILERLAFVLESLDRKQPGVMAPEGGASLPDVGK
jgi:hypothetical protein